MVHRSAVFAVAVAMAAVVMAAVVTAASVGGGRQMNAPVGQSVADPAAAQRAQDTEDQARSSGEQAHPRCALPPLVGGSAAERLVVIGIVVDAIRTGECAVASPQHRLCRSLFLNAATDPVAGVGAGLDAGQLRHIAALHTWAVTDGAEAAAELEDDALLSAFRTLLSLDIEAALSVGDEAIAAIAIARADPVILEALMRAESECG